MERGDEQWERIKTMYLTGESRNRIRQKLGISFATLATVVKEEGLPIRPSGYAKVPVPEGSAKEFYHNQQGKCGVCNLPLPPGMRLIAGPNKPAAQCMVCPACWEIVMRVQWRPSVIDSLYAILHTGQKEPEVPVATGGFYKTLSGPPVLTFSDGRLCVDVGNGQYSFVAPKHVVFGKKDL